MYKNHRYRIYPTKNQIELIEKTFGCCRLVYNLALETNITAYKNAGIRLSGIDLCYQLVDLKNEYPWLQEVDSQALRESVKKIDVAFNKFFNGCGYPKYKNRKGRQSFQCSSNARRIDFDKGLLTIPKIPNIPVVVSRKFKGEIKTITISKTQTGKYFASILVDNKKEPPTKPKVLAQNAIGIDLGLTHFAILSNGEKINNERHLKKKIERLKVLQRRTSRKKKGSNNKKKANLKVALLHEQIANSRKDFIHKFTTRLVRDSQATTFCMEDLAVSNMMQNHKLAQAIGDVGWGEVIHQMYHKCDWYGKNFIQIGRFEPSTKICSNCKAKNETLTLADREWICSNCNTLHDRDINAAKNIKRIGIRQYVLAKQNSGQDMSGESVEMSTLVESKKQKNIKKLI